MNEREIRATCVPIMQLLHRVESGATKGAAGSWSADGKPVGPDKLRAVHVGVEELRALRRALRIPDRLFPVCPTCEITVVQPARAGRLVCLTCKAEFEPLDDECPRCGKSLAGIDRDRHYLECIPK